MLKSRTELFISSDTKEKWLKALNEKVSKNKEVLPYIVNEIIVKRDNEVAELRSEAIKLKIKSERLIKELKIEREEIQRFHEKSEEYSLKQVDTIKEQKSTIKAQSEEI